MHMILTVYRGITLNFYQYSVLVGLSAFFRPGERLYNADPGKISFPSLLISWATFAPKRDVKLQLTYFRPSPFFNSLPFLSPFYIHFLSHFPFPFLSPAFPCPPLSHPSTSLRLSFPFLPLPCSFPPLPSSCPVTFLLPFPGFPTLSHPFPFCPNPFPSALVV